MRLRLLPLLREVRRVAAGGGEAHVALAPLAAAGDEVLFAVGVHVAQQLAVSASRTRVPRGRAMTTSSPPLPKQLLVPPPLAVARLEAGAEAELDEVVLVLVADDVHVAALAAVAAVRAAVREALKLLKEFIPSPPSPDLTKIFTLSVKRDAICPTSARPIGAPFCVFLGRCRPRGALCGAFRRPSCGLLCGAFGSPLGGAFGSPLCGAFGSPLGGAPALCVGRGLLILPVPRGGRGFRIFCGLPRGGRGRPALPSEVALGRERAAAAGGLLRAGRRGARAR